MRRAVGVLCGVLLMTTALAGCKETDSTPWPEQQGCGPIAHEQVRGERPGYAGAELSRFANDHALCEGRWLPMLEDGFVPQGLALRGRRAWVSGYVGHHKMGHRTCMLTEVNLRTGRPLREIDTIIGTIGAREPVECRHGGGLGISEHGLWLAEKARLWLIDPERAGNGRGVIRGWALDEGVMGSMLLQDGRGRLGLGEFDESGAGKVHWFDPATVVASDAISLVPPGEADAGQLAASRRGRTPPWTQGGVWLRGGPWFVASSTTCAELIGPGGRRVSFVPGAEGVQHDGRGHLWVVSEAPAKKYQREDRPLVPALSRIDIRQLLRGNRGDCDR